MISTTLPQQPPASQPSPANRTASISSASKMTNFSIAAIMNHGFHTPNEGKIIISCRAICNEISPRLVSGYFIITLTSFGIIIILFTALFDDAGDIFIYFNQEGDNNSLLSFVIMQNI